MAKKVKFLTAEAAARLAVTRESDAPPPAVAVRGAVVTALLEVYLRFVEQRAAAGRRQMKWHEIGVIPMRFNLGEKVATFDELRKLGYTVDADGVRW